MASTTARTNILNKIRQALSNPVPLPFPGSEQQQTVFAFSEEDIAVTFAHEFTSLQGKFFFCQNEAIFKQEFNLLVKEKGWSKILFKEDKISALMDGLETYGDLASSDVAITGCECLVARTGTIVMSAAQQSGRTASVYSPIHVCVAWTNQLMYDVSDAITVMKKRYKDIPSLITFASGPSRTADIEKTLVTGVHGPKEVYCFLIEA